MEGVGGRTGRGALPACPTDLAGTSRPLGDGPIATSGPPGAPRSLVQKKDLLYHYLKKQNYIKRVMAHSESFISSDFRALQSWVRFFSGTQKFYNVIYQVIL